MSAPWAVEYGGSKWGLVRYNVRKWPEGLTCGLCGKAIRKGTGCYRTRTWGPNHDQTEHWHQKCLLGQIDPTIWDIPIGQ